MKHDYLIYVEYSLNGLYVFHAKTGDIYHTMGEILWRSFQTISSISYAVDTIDRREWWKKEGISIREWKDKL